jgi:hypothetical protein
VLRYVVLLHWPAWLLRCSSAALHCFPVPNHWLAWLLRYFAVPLHCSRGLTEVSTAYISRTSFREERRITKSEKGLQLTVLAKVPQDLSNRSNVSWSVFNFSNATLVALRERSARLLFRITRISEKYPMSPSHSLKNSSQALLIFESTPESWLRTALAFIVHSSAFFLSLGPLSSSE